MGSKKTVASLVITEKQQAMPVITVLKEELKLGNRQIQKIIRTKGLFLDERAVHSKTKVKAGQYLKVLLPVQEQIRVTPTPIQLEVLFEDPWLLAVNKPAGLVVHHTKSKSAPSLIGGVADYFISKDLYITPRPVHRLDRDTSGVVLFAKSSAVQTELSTLWHTDKIIKEYWALVEGAVTSNGEISTAIRGKSARTTYFPLNQYAGVSELRVAIQTGRTHQIRVHLSSINYPIVGDALYNKKSHLAARRLALHASSLTILHPKSREQLTITSPHPRSQFTELLTQETTQP